DQTDQTDLAEPSDTVAAPLAAVDTPVKLAPVLNFSDETAPPARESTSGMRWNPNVTDVDRLSSQEDEAELVAIGQRDLPITKTPTTEPAPVKPNDLTRKPIAVATPTIKIENSDSNVDQIQEAIKAVTHDPSQATGPVSLPEVSPEEFVSELAASEPEQELNAITKSATDESAQAIAQSAAPVANPLLDDDEPDDDEPIDRPGVEFDNDTLAMSRDTVHVPMLPPTLPRITEADATDAPLVAAPVAVDPSLAATGKRNGAQEPVEPESNVDSSKATGTPARLASSQHSVQRRPLTAPGQRRLLEGHSSLPEPSDQSGQLAQSDQASGEDPNSESESGSEAVVLQLSRAQVRSMTIGGRLRRVSIANKDVCQAFASGANQIKLIGTGIGQTQLTIWADIVPGEPTRMQTFDVDVSEAVNATGDKIAEHTALLNDSIDKAFPRASVVVSRQGGELVVTGHCDDEATAKQIVRMVRKSCLVPVQDNLKVR
ncbi:MAG: pilus assembly protein N-terminal domain-containing protein, partial [Planctomycetales bacterium]|nr:pilus assembly protein N-terminal domain-containing protein [Planctomycetales bacterium]